MINSLCLCFFRKNNSDSVLVKNFAVNCSKPEYRASATKVICKVAAQDWNTCKICPYFFLMFTLPVVVFGLIGYFEITVH